MEKEELERELEKAEKGCVITIINQSSLPLIFDGSRHPHGKFKCKPPKTVVAREASSFSLEGRKSIEASAKFKWGKGRLELFWNLPEHGDPKIFYRVGTQLKNKLFVYIPSAVFGKITKFIFLVDEKPVTPLTPQELTAQSNTDTNEDFSSENVSDTENEMGRSNSNGEIALTPKVYFDPNQLKSPSVHTSPKDDEDEMKGPPSDPNSFGFSSDEEDEPKKYKIVIKPITDMTPTTLITPVIGIVPPVSGPPTGRRRANTKTRDTSPFADLPENLFQQPSTINAPVLPITQPTGEVRERRLSLSGDLERNKVTATRNSLPLDGLMSLGFSSNSLPQLTTPPLTPVPSPLPTSTFSFASLSPNLTPTSPPSPTPISRQAGRASSFELGRLSFEDLRALGASPPAPLTPKTAHAPDITLVPRSSTIMPQPLAPMPSLPKSPPIVSGAPSSGAMLIPSKPTNANHPVTSPPKPILNGGSPLLPGVGSAPSSSPARTNYAPMSPPLNRGSQSNGTTFDSESPSSRQPPRRYSEPPPVDPNLLFPELNNVKDKTKKADILVPAQKYMQAAMVHLEKNMIAAALGNLDLCISLLATIAEETAAEIEYCIRYRLFFVLLKEIAKPKPPSEHAYLSFFLSDIAVKPYHRVVAIRMAIRHNMTSQNFGIAAGLLQLLIERVHPIDEHALQDKLRKCLSQNRSNSDVRFRKYTCPGCEASTSLSSTKCNLCQHPIKMCTLTLEIIATKAYYCCKLCKLNFSRKAISPRESELKCPFCKVGDLTNKVFVASK